MTGRILMMLNAPYPADIRVKKEATALINSGFELHLLCLRRKKQAKQEVIDGIHLHRIFAGTNNIQLAFWDAIISVARRHPKFLKAARKILKAGQFDFIHVHDLPLNGTALDLRKQFKIKVVSDFHENYAEGLKIWFAWKKNPLVRIKNNLFMNPKHWAKYEKDVCKHADAIITVVNEMKQRIIDECHISDQKITVITNTEEKSFVRDAIIKNVYGELSGSFILTYAGGIGPHRGVDTAIRGMAHLSDFKNIHLAIVGSGSPSVMQSLNNLVTQLELDNVHFFGFQPFENFPSFMSLASVNIIPHLSTGHTNNTVPHKLFQGMMTGKPLLVSSSTPLKRIVEQYKAGVVFDAGSPKHFAEQSLLLYNNPDLCQQLGTNGSRATLEGSLNWETTQIKLVNLYKSLK